MNFQIKDAVESTDNGRKSAFTLFAKRPTQVASAAEQDHPLHVQFPPVAFLSWTIADELIKLAASRCDELVWFKMTAPYRNESSI